MYNENSIIIHVGTTTNNLGKILKVNQGAIKYLQYTKEELESSNINIILLRRIKEKHDKFLKNYMQKGESNVLFEERSLFLRKKTGYSSSITIIAKPMYFSHNNSFNFVGYMQPKNEETDIFIVCSETGVIDGVSHKMCQLLNLIPQDFEEHNLYLQNLCPDLFDYFLQRNEDGKTLKNLNFNGKLIDAENEGFILMFYEYRNAVDSFKKCVENNVKNVFDELKIIKKRILKILEARNNQFKFEKNEDFDNGRISLDKSHNFELDGSMNCSDYKLNLKKLILEWLELKSRIEEKIKDKNVFFKAKLNIVATKSEKIELIVVTLEVAIFKQKNYILLRRIKFKFFYFMLIFFFFFSKEIDFNSIDEFIKDEIIEKYKSSNIKMNNSSCLQMKKMKTIAYDISKQSSKLFNDYKLKPVNNIDFSITMKNNSTFKNPFSKANDEEKGNNDEEEKEKFLIFSKISSDEDSIKFPSEEFLAVENEAEKYNLDSEKTKTNLNESPNKLSLINNVKSKIIFQKDDNEGSVGSINSNFQIKKLIKNSINSEYIPKDFTILKLVFFVKNFFIFLFFVLSGVFIFYNFVKIDEEFIFNKKVKQFSVYVLRSSRNCYLLSLASKNDGLIIPNKTKMRLLKEIDNDISSLNSDIEYLSHNFIEIKTQLFEDKINFQFTHKNSINISFIKSSLNYIGKLKEYVFMLKNEQNSTLLRNSEYLYSLIINFQKIVEKINLRDFIANKEKELIKLLKTQAVIFAISGCLIAIILIIVEMVYFKNGFEEINKIFNLLTIINPDDIVNLMNYVDITSQLFTNVIDQDEMYENLANCKKKVEKLKKVADTKRKIKYGKLIKFPIVKVFIGKSLIFSIIILLFFSILFVSDIFNENLNDMSDLEKLIDNKNYVDGNCNFIITLDFYSKYKFNYNILSIQKNDFLDSIKKLQTTKNDVAEIKKIEINFKEIITSLIFHENLCGHTKLFTKSKCESLLNGNLRYGKYLKKIKYFFILICKE